MLVSSALVLPQLVLILEFNGLEILPSLEKGESIFLLLRCGDENMGD